jgi:hypothetical protein
MISEIDKYTSHSLLIPPHHLPGLRTAVVSFAATVLTEGFSASLFGFHPTMRRGCQSRQKAREEGRGKEVTIGRR